MARVTLYSSKEIRGTSEDCQLTFNVDLPPHPNGYQLAIESFTMTGGVSSFALFASGIFNQTSYDDSAAGEKINLVVATNAIMARITEDTIGFKLGRSLKNQIINIQIYNSLGQIYTAFPTWILQCVVYPITPKTLKIL